MPLIRRPDTPSPPPPAARADALASPNADARWAAVRSLSERCEGRARIIEALQHEREPRVLEAIFTALAHDAGPEAVDALIDCIGSDEAVIRTGAMDALRAAPAALAPRLPGLLAHADPDVRLLACDLARVVPPAEAAELLCARLAVEPEANVCSAAIETLAEVGDAAAAPALAACAERFTHDPFLKFAAAEAARRFGGGPGNPRG